MIPEQAKSEIIRRRALGATWTAIANWMNEEYGTDTHRTTIQRWHDKEVEGVQEEQVLHPEDSLAQRVKLDKIVATQKSEATFYKKLYQKALKENTKKNLLLTLYKSLPNLFQQSR